MFPLAVPAKHLGGLAAGAWVLDPFCGRGSTNYAARLVGLSSVGIDSNPVATAITAGKLASASVASVVEACDEALDEIASIEPPQGEFWKRCYHRQTLADLCRVRAALLNNCNSPKRKALRALLLGLLHGPLNKGDPSYLSNQMPRTFSAKPAYAVRFWKSRDLRPNYVDLRTLVARKARHFFSVAPPAVPAHVVTADSRTFDFKTLGLKFSRVITSPPYYGMRTYVPDQWLRYWFVGGPETVTYRQSTQLAHGSANDFAEQLALIWTNVSRVCSPGAKMVIRFGGIHDRKANPKDIMTAALRGATHRLHLSTIRSAGVSSKGKRQADQFRRTLRHPIEEFDFHVRVEE
jgi:hypothetical protein